MTMPDYIRFPLVLVMVAGVSAAALAGLQRATEPTKERMQNQITERALRVVMPEAVAFEKIEGAAEGSRFAFRKAYGADDALLGYVAEGSAEGYSSRILVMVGVTPEFTINAIKILSQKETPGLGDMIEQILSKKTWWTVITRTSPDERGLRPWFQVQFDGRTLPVNLDKYGGTVEAITGATISSKAVCDAVNAAVMHLKEVLHHA